MSNSPSVYALGTHACHRSADRWINEEVPSFSSSSPSRAIATRGTAPAVRGTVLPTATQDDSRLIHNIYLGFLECVLESTVHTNDAQPLIGSFLLLLTRPNDKSEVTRGEVELEESRRLSRYSCMNMLCPAPAPPVRCPEPHATLPDVCASRPLAMRLQACFDYTLLHGCS